MTSGLGRFPSGVLAGVLMLLLVTYAIAKRARLPLVAKFRGRVPLSRWLYVSHIAFGTFAAGVVALTRLNSAYMAEIYRAAIVVRRAEVGL